MSTLIEPSTSGSLHSLVQNEQCIVWRTKIFKECAIIWVRCSRKAKKTGCPAFTTKFPSLPASLSSLFSFWANSHMNSSFFSLPSFKCFSFYEFCSLYKIGFSSFSPFTFSAKIFFGISDSQKRCTWRANGFKDDIRWDILDNASF